MQRFESRYQHKNENPHSLIGFQSTPREHYWNTIFFNYNKKYCNFKTIMRTATRRIGFNGDNTGNGNFDWIGVPECNKVNISAR